jgi:hypothetical protein
MITVQKADPAAKRQALMIIFAGFIIGALSIFGLHRYKSALLGFRLGLYHFQKEGKVAYPLQFGIDMGGPTRLRIEYAELI